MVSNIAILFNINHLFARREMVTNIAIYIGMMVTVFVNGSGDRGSIPGRVIPKT